MLHLLAFSPDEQALLEQATLSMNEEDAVVLLEAGQAFARSTSTLAQLTSLAPGIRLYLLGDAGIAEDLAVERIDSAGLVALTEQHDASQSWYPERD